MGWTGGQLQGPPTALNLIEFELGREFRNRVLATHKKGGVVYAAVRHHKSDIVFGLVLLVQRRNGLVYTKAITDSMGPVESECPLEILDLLTPNDEPYARKWRERCRENATRPKPRKGQRVVFASPIAFSDGKSRSAFTYQGRTRFVSDDGVNVTIPRWSQRDHTLA